ncbi:MAG: RNA-binding protein [Acidobacteriales bacterium]|nr:RNA-binding protein [Terriglobales bacterium]
MYRADPNGSEAGLKKLFVANFSFDTLESHLLALFKVYGQVDRVSIATDRDTGRSRGFGFVEMPDASAADMAISGLDGSHFRGRVLTVSEARTTNDRIAERRLDHHRAV